MLPAAIAAMSGVVYIASIKMHVYMQMILSCVTAIAAGARIIWVARRENAAVGSRS